MVDDVDKKKKQEEELLKKSVAQIMSKVSKFEKKDIVEKLEELFLVRLRNEYHIAEAIKLGVDSNKLSVNRAVELLKSSKDGLSNLGQLLRLFGGESTSSSEGVIRVEHVEIRDRLEQLRGERDGDGRYN